MGNEQSELSMIDNFTEIENASNYTNIESF